MTQNAQLTCVGALGFVWEEMEKKVERIKEVKLAAPLSITPLYVKKQAVPLYLNWSYTYSCLCP